MDVHITLDSLPSEVVNRICTFISPRDLLCFRLCSRATAAKSRHQFGQRCFACNRFLLTSKNTAILEAIAQHDHFRTVVRGVYIVPALFEGRYSMDQVEYRQWASQSRARRTLYPSRARRDDLEIPDDKLLKYYPAYKEVVADHLDVVFSGKLREILAYCASRFPNLTSVGLSHYNAERQDLLNLNRRLDCPEWRDLVARLGCDPAIPWHITSPFKEGTPNVRASVFTSLLRTLITPGAENLALKELNTCHTASKYVSCCSGLMLGELDLSSDEQELILARLESMKLEKLHMCIRDFHGQKHPEYYLFMNKIVSRVSPTLSYFRSMRSPTHEGYEYAKQQISWLAHNTSFSSLSRLELGGISTSMGDFKRLLATAASTLRYATLWDIYLRVDNPPPGSEECARLGRQLWREMWTWLGENLDPLAITISSLYGPGHGGVRIRDRLHGFRGTHPTINASNVGQYRKTKSHVSFKEWISQLRFEKLMLSPRESSDEEEELYSE
ncbi:unnamed protein product [Clonostachys byssicola]|uniref:F-box domain-containing protein n=1 Tax=Clonostachys byssicola TaxID=160290 RepID=A0A9N9V0N9_9HYPO|nr:unnamed protein product [Clonostachys byssicola]